MTRFAKKFTDARVGGPRAPDDLSPCLLLLSVYFDQLASLATITNTSYIHLCCSLGLEGLSLLVCLEISY